MGQGFAIHFLMMRTIGLSSLVREGSKVLGDVMESSDVEVDKKNTKSYEGGAEIEIYDCHMTISVSLYHGSLEHKCV
jgi:predicted nucleotidyltransferase